MVSKISGTALFVSLGALLAPDSAHAGDATTYYCYRPNQPAQYLNVSLPKGQWSALNNTNNFEYDVRKGRDSWQHKNRSHITVRTKCSNAFHTYIENHNGDQDVCAMVIPRVKAKRYAASCLGGAFNSSTGFCHPAGGAVNYEYQAVPYNQKTSNWPDRTNYDFCPEGGTFQAYPSGDYEIKNAVKISNPGQKQLSCSMSGPDPKVHMQKTFGIADGKAETYTSRISHDLDVGEGATSVRISMGVRPKTAHKYLSTAQGIRVRFGEVSGVSGMRSTVFSKHLGLYRGNISLATLGDNAIVQRRWEPESIKDFANFSFDVPTLPSLTGLDRPVPDRRLEVELPVFGGVRTEVDYLKVEWCADLKVRDLVGNVAADTLGQVRQPVVQPSGGLPSASSATMIGTAGETVGETKARPTHRKLETSKARDEERSKKR